MAAFQRVRRQLADQLGVGPGRRCKEVEALVLGHSATLEAQQPLD